MLPQLGGRGGGADSARIGAAQCLHHSQAVRSHSLTGCLAPERRVSRRGLAVERAGRRRGGQLWRERLAGPRPPLGSRRTPQPQSSHQGLGASIAAQGHSFTRQGPTRVQQSVQLGKRMSKKLTASLGRSDRADFKPKYALAHSDPRRPIGSSAASWHQCGLDIPLMHPQTPVVSPSPAGSWGPLFSPSRPTFCLPPHPIWSPRRELSAGSG